MGLFAGVYITILGLSYLKECQADRPNIVIIYADDLGWNDVSHHGSPQIPTPNIDALGMSGIVLHNYYGEYLCTPSRAALMTGKYPIRVGMQHDVLRAGQPAGLPLSETILPQYLKRLGYKTHIVGKWHLGYPTSEYTPTYRGFDTFLGYLNGLIDYYDFSYYESTPDTNSQTYWGLDFYNGTELAGDSKGQYATYLFADEARKVILNHDVSKPLFLYLSHLAPHVANPQQRLQAPPVVTDRFRYIRDIGRRMTAATTAVLDEVVGDTVEALYQKGILDNTILLFASDNGGEQIDPEWNAHASNYPLRGKKETMWEGGVRVVSLAWSTLFNLTEPQIFSQLMHVSDWLPTLYRAAGGDPSDLGEIDGIDMWDMLVHNQPSPRTNLLQGSDPIWGMSAYRNKGMKVVNGSAPGNYDLWYGPPGFSDFPPGFPQSMTEWVFKNGSIVRDIFQEAGYWIIKDSDEWYEQTTVRCPEPAPMNNSNCDPTQAPCLFNITNDPCEHYNLADQYTEMLAEMMGTVLQYAKEAVPPVPTVIDPKGDPMCHNFTYVPWLDEQYYNECQYAAPTP